MKKTITSQTQNQSSYLPIFVNLVSAVMCVLTNKYVLREWKHTIFLTAVHSSFTFLTLLILLACRFYEYRRLSFTKILPLSILFLAMITFNNLSIQFNPIGFYLVMKIAVTPAVAFVEVIFLKNKLTLLISISLIIMLIGIGLTSAVSFKTNVTGFFVALAGTILTVLYQFLPKHLQLKEDCNEYQLLLFQMPISALILFALTPFESYIDPGASGSIFTASYSTRLIGGIAVTTFMAVFINLTATIIIKRTSALTYCVASQLKTVGVLLGGVLLFKEVLTLQKWVGIGLALGGIMWYTYLKYVEQRKHKGQGGGQGKKGEGKEEVRDRNQGGQGKKRERKKGVRQGGQSKKGGKKEEVQNKS